VEQSGQPQRESTLASLYQIVTHRSHLLSEQESERQAISALIEYLQVFQEELANKRNDHFIPFDTGLYQVDKAQISASLYLIALLINEALRKKSIARTGRKLMVLSDIANMLSYISPCFGIANISPALALMLYERPSGFLDPLSDAEWQMLSEKAVADMLQREGQPGQQRGAATYFSGRSFYAIKTYQFANNEALHKAEEIVATEKVRLNLFLEALQGTLRFLDRLTLLPQYQEMLLSINLEADRTILAEQMIALLMSLLGDSVSVQEEHEQKSKREIGIVESELSLPALVNLQIRKEEHTSEQHIYHLTLTDSTHLDEPITFLLRVAESGEAELFEDDSDG